MSVEPKRLKSKPAMYPPRRGKKPTIENYQPSRGMKSDERGTPWDLFLLLHAIFCFTWDVCASPRNHKCRCYWTKKHNAIALSWLGLICFMNPPYSPELTVWVQKACLEALQGTTIVAVLPAWCDAAWFRRHCTDAYPVMLCGRVQFEGYTGIAPWGCMVCVWNGTSEQLAKLDTALGVKRLTIGIGTMPTK